MTPPEEYSQGVRTPFTGLNQLSLSLRLGSFSSEIANWGLFEHDWWRNYLHTHSFFEVCYAFAGSGRFSLGQVDYTVQAGDVFIARPGDIHEIISDEQTPLGIYFWSYTLVPRPMLPGSEESDERTEAINALLRAFIASKRCVSRRTSMMQRTLDLLTEEIARHEPGYTQVIEGLVSKLLLDTARSVVNVAELAEEKYSLRDPTQATVQMIVRYLHDNYHRPLAIRDLAAQAHLSERHTSRLFQKVMGQSIMDYLTTLRMNIAAQRLLERQVPLKEIAQETGYPDVRYFITLFRQTMGVTPAVFRREGGTRFVS